MLLRRMKSRWLAVLSFAIGSSAFAQTTQGLISGRLRSSVTGAPIAAATVTYLNFETNAGGTAQSDKSGYRSEERRVGKECRYRRAANQRKENTERDV